MTKEIQLTRGMVALVDDADFQWLSQWKWFSLKASNGYYAARQTPKGVSGHIYIHHLLLEIPEGLQVDHINHNTLDNQRSNLRLASINQNCQNRRKKQWGKNSSQYKGVSRRVNTWDAYICPPKCRIRLGSFASEEAAARAYDQAARELFGEFAYLNFPDEVSL